MIVDWIIRRAMRTPYFHLEGYMDRWWLFNGYPEGKESERRWKWLPSIRIHHILRADLGRHLHDHPWNARTIILRGWYTERRREMTDYPRFLGVENRMVIEPYTRRAGQTAKLKFGEYHTIDEVSPGGVWTFFIIGKYRGEWGFLVNGKKIPHDQYWRKP